MELVRHWADFARVDVPVQIILGDERPCSTCRCSPPSAGRWQCFGFSVIVCPATNHFMQLQQPAWCAPRLAAFANSNSKASRDADAANNDKGPNAETTRGSAIGF
ncbi:hypothetical protein X732_30620 [Mesorhizobium sp. L2C066B000]|nr:hypothetical protein X732_30620 [Mesorhizobium sp. L2C066B000]